jgi:hypothetical protein
MTEQHPLTPPPELVQQWADMIATHTDTEVFSAAAQWGADQELEACCEWLQHDYPNIGANALRFARRPKPPSLKEQALGLLNEGPVNELLDHEVDTIRRALEALPDD